MVPEEGNIGNIYVVPEEGGPAAGGEALRISYEPRFEPRFEPPTPLVRFDYGSDLHHREPRFLVFLQKREFWSCRGTGLP